MFDPKTGIEVRIKPYGSNDPYHEYPAPSKSTLYAQGRNETFIEAVTDQRYVIEVISMAAKSNGGGVLDNPHRNEAAPTEISSFVTGFTKTVAGQKIWCGFAFGSVIMNEDPFSTRDQEDRELGSKGKIVVELQRGDGLERIEKKSETKDTQTTERMMLHEETSKKVARDNLSVRDLKPVPLEKVASNHGTKDKDKYRISSWKPAEGAAGVQLHFTFFYTSRKYLEANGLIPITNHTNTDKVTIDLDNVEPTPGASKGRQVKVCGPDERQHKPADAADVSANHLSDETSQNDKLLVNAATQHGLSAATLATPNQTRQDKSTKHGERRDEDDEEMLPPKRIKRDSTEDLYSATPPPEDRQSGRAYPFQPGTQLAEQQASTATPSLTQAAKAKRKLALQRRLEELRILRELDELDDE